MQESTLTRLDLRTPLLYEQMPALMPFKGVPPRREAAGEQLFCFELEPEQAGRIDPEADNFLGTLVWAGQGSRAIHGGQGTERLSAGLYLFTQQRAVLDRAACIRLAIEQQKDGLWERLVLENRLFIRRLFEDGSPVTQILRPYGT